MRSWSSSAACAGVAGLTLILAACAQSPSSPSLSSAVAGRAEATAGAGNGAKVEMCHVLGNGGIVRINVAASAVSAHVGHGDSVAADFSGGWAGGQVTLTHVGQQVTGVWVDGSRDNFYGSVPNGGCTVDMYFPDDLPYRGTVVDANACKIQWSYPGDLTSTDPNNFWIRDSCN